MLKYLKWLLTPFSLGVLITTVYMTLAQHYYVSRELQTPNEKQSFVFRLLERLDHAITDIRFELRGPQSPRPDIALVAIDDISVQEMGRWPWGRDKMAELVDHLMGYGAQALGFDIVFSEVQLDQRISLIDQLQKTPQLQTDIQNLLENERKSAQPDQKLAQVFDKHKDKLVLGGFTEGNSIYYHAYSDFCYHEYLKRNPSFALLKNLPPFLNDETIGMEWLRLFRVLEEEEINAFTNSFNPIFDKIVQDSTQEFLKKKSKSSVEDLDFSEKQSLASQNLYQISA